MAKGGLGDYSSAKPKFSRDYPGLGFGAELSGQSMLPTLGSDIRDVTFARARRCN